MQGKVSQEQRYEQFKLQWMIDHGYTLPDLIKQLGAAVQDCQYEVTDESTLQRLFEEWEFGCGFVGAIWPCYEEFVSCDYQE